MKIKVVIFGEGDTGKSTLVRHFIPTATSVEAKRVDGSEITIGIDFGKINMAGYDIHFFGTPGQHRFDFARKYAARGAHIGILMLDSEVVNELGITQRELDIEEEMINTDLPYLICANKQDVEGVTPASEMQKNFQIDEVLPISAATGEGVGRLMHDLFDLIEDNYGEPDAEEHLTVPVRELTREL